MRPLFGETQCLHVKRIAALVTSSLACMLLTELAARRLLASDEQARIGARALLLRDTNAFTEGYHDCTWADSLMAHPYLAYVHRRRGKCSVPRVNSAGMLSDYSLPHRRADEFFTVLLEGGSVAQQLGSGPWLENALSNQFVLPDGRKFRVINAAMGATTYPRHAIVTLLYGHSVDAVILLDGFNEVTLNNPAMGVLLGAPGPIYFAQVRLAATAWDAARTQLAGTVRVRMAQIPLVSHSFLWFFLVEAVTNLILGEAAELGTNSALQDETYLASYIAPRSWDQDRRFQRHQEDYQHGVKLNYSLSRSLEVHFSHFLQPVPNLFKPLTRLERAGVMRHFPSRHYLNIERSLAQLHDTGVPTHSLLRLFEDLEEEIYEDFIHCTMDDEHKSPGYQKLAAAIAEQVGMDWNLTQK